MGIRTDIVKIMQEHEGEQTSARIAFWLDSDMFPDEDEDTSEWEEHKSNVRHSLKMLEYQGFVEKRQHFFRYYWKLV